MDQEHVDRMARLKRLSRIERIAPPEFEQYMVPQSEHRLTNYPAPMPVLRVIFRDKVFFDFNESELRSQAYTILDVIAASLRKEPPDVTVFVAGHTDSVGTPAYNYKLGLRRAKTVAVALAKLGVNRAQVFLVSFGEAVPIASNATDAGRARNRRVEFLFAAQPAPIAAWLARQPTAPCAQHAQPGIAACSVKNNYRAVSVRLASLGTQIISDAGHQDVNTTKSKVNVDKQQATTNVIIGEKVVNIDLKSKIFSMPAPE